MVFEGGTSSVFTISGDDKSKKVCYISDEHIYVTQTRAKIKLQGILDKTTERLIKVQTEIIRTEAFLRHAH